MTLRQGSFFEEFEELINVKPRAPRTRAGAAKSDKPAAKKQGRFPQFAAPCDSCPLSHYSKLMESVGLDRQFLVIVDRPSMRSISNAMPFTDPAVEHLLRMLGQHAIAPEQVGFVYALRCACHDKDIDKEPMQRCGNYLTRDIAMANPHATILCASEIGARYLFGARTLRAIRGRVLEFNGRKVVGCQEPALAAQDPSAQDLLQHDIVRFISVAKGEYKLPEFKYQVLTHPDEIIDVLKYLRTLEGNTLYGWDVETMWFEHLKPYATDCYSEHFRIWSMAFAWEDYRAFVMPWDPDPTLLAKYPHLPSIHSHPQIYTETKGLLENRRVVEHMKVDARWMAGKYDVDVGLYLPLQQFEDTHGMHFLINPEDLGGNDLKRLVREHTPEGGYEDEIGFVPDAAAFDWDKWGLYNCHDADATRRLVPIFRPKMVETGQDRVYELLLKPVTMAVLHMELDGLQLDKAFLEEQAKRREEEMSKALAVIRADKLIAQFVAHCMTQASKIKAAAVGRKLTKAESNKLEAFEAVKSPADFEVKNTHLAALLYDICGLEITKKTDKGDPSTEAEIFEASQKRWPLFTHILAYKKAQKLLSTYILPYTVGKLDGKGRLINPPHIKADGRAHPTIKPTGARTGRSSCENPNGQNIKNEYEARRPFTTRFTGGSLVAADYSQAEIRIAAVQCKDPILSAALQHDIHNINLAVIEGVTDVATAKAVLSGPVEGAMQFAQKITVDLETLCVKRVAEQERGGPIDKALKFYKKVRRTVAKKFMFGPMYGQSIPGIVKQLVAELGISQRAAEEMAPAYLTALKALYAKYFAWAEANVPIARQQGYVESIFGRRRPLAYAAANSSTTKNDHEIRAMLAALDRKVTNTKVQGPASDLCLLAGVHLVEIFKNRRLSPKTELRDHLLESALNSPSVETLEANTEGAFTPAMFEEYIAKVHGGRGLSRTVLPIHDSLITDCPPEERFGAAIIVATVMAEVPQHYVDTSGVVFAADVEVGPNLGEVEKLTL